MACLVAGAAAGTTAYIDNAAVRRSFAKELEALHKADETTAIETLRRQAAKKHSHAIEPLAARTKALAPTDLYRQAREGVVSVGKLYKCNNCSRWHVSMATGFVIHKDGVIVTNYHVIEEKEKNEKEAPTLGIRTHDGRVFPVTEVLAASKNDDLVVMKVEAENLSALPVSGGAEIGTPIWVISHPQKHLYTFSEGIVSGRYTHEHGGTKNDVITITADFAKGSSGAPVLNANGAVVGIARATTSIYYKKVDGVDSNLQMVWKRCVPAERLLDLLW